MTADSHPSFEGGPAAVAEPESPATPFGNRGELTEP